MKSLTATSVELRFNNYSGSKKSGWFGISLGKGYNTSSSNSYVTAFSVIEAGSIDLFSAGDLWAMGAEIASSGDLGLTVAGAPRLRGGAQSAKGGRPCLPWVGIRGARPVVAAVGRRSICARIARRWRGGGAAWGGRDETGGTGELVRNAGEPKLPLTFISSALIDARACTGVCGPGEVEC